MLDPTFKFEYSFIDLLFKLDSELKNKFWGSSMFNFYIWICYMQLASFTPDLNLSSMHEIDVWQNK